MFKLEFEKLISHKNTKILLSIYLIALIFFLGIYLVGESALNISIFNTGQFVVASLNMMMALILPFIALYLSSHSFISEYRKNTLKNILLLPVKKSEIFIGKLMSIQVLLGGMLIFQFIVTSTFGIIMDGFSFSATGILVYLNAYIILGLVSLFAAVLSGILSTTGMVVIFSTITYLSLNFITLLLPRLQVISLSYMLSNYQIILASGTLLLSLVAYYIILYIIGYQLFEKKEAIICLSE